MEPGIDTPPAADPATAEQHEEAGVPAAEVRWLRLAWAGEFLVATIAGIMMWSEVGGQVHLDMMPWYLKLAPLLALAWSTVRFTMAFMEPAPMSRGRSRRWLLTMVLIGVIMGAITWYYHIHEPIDDSDEDEGLSTSIPVSPAAQFRGWA